MEADGRVLHPLIFLWLHPQPCNCNRPSIPLSQGAREYQFLLARLVHILCIPPSRDANGARQGSGRRERSDIPRGRMVQRGQKASVCPPRSRARLPSSSRSRGGHVSVSCGSHVDRELRQFEATLVASRRPLPPSSKSLFHPEVAPSFPARQRVGPLGRSDVGLKEDHLHSPNDGGRIGSLAGSRTLSFSARRPRPRCKTVETTAGATPPRPPMSPTCHSRAGAARVVARCWLKAVSPSDRRGDRPERKFYSRR